MLSRWTTALASAALLPALATPNRTAAQTEAAAGLRYVEREIRLPLPGSMPNGLDAIEVYVATPGKHPLVLLTHGTSAIPEERMQITPWAQLAQALWFARRGYVALVITRRGYGNSGGEQDGTHGGCRSGGQGSFQEAGEASADDLRKAVDYAGEQMPEADTTQVISVGVSTGGFAQVALAADPPPGLKAAVSFAGGRGGDGKGHLCDEGGLIAAYKTFGEHARVPMLWIYSENDKWFSPAEARKFEAAFQGGGGVDDLITAPPDGDDGHHFYNHVSAWSETVDTFLRGHDLEPVTKLYPPPPLPDVPPPAGLHDRGIEAFHVFLGLGPKKAFATNGAGVYGFAVGMFTQDLADKRALENCAKALHGGTACQIVARTAVASAR